MAVGPKDREPKGRAPPSPLPYTVKLIGYVYPDKPGRYRPDIGHEWVREMYEAARKPSPEPAETFGAADVEKTHLLLRELELWHTSPSR